MDLFEQPSSLALVDALLDLAIREDIGIADATTQTLIPEDARMRAAYVLRSRGVVSGLRVMRRFFERFDPCVGFDFLARDGDTVSPGATLALIHGPARSILTGERISLNLLQRLSGIATLTKAYVDAVAGTRAKILDTRKTTPGLRILEKAAVVDGGGYNHRMGLYDMILIKDNHLAMKASGLSPLGVRDAMTRARAVSQLPVMIEVDTLAQFDEALKMEPEYILLDNMPPSVMAEAVGRADAAAANGLRRPELEASGGITLETVRAAAESGVDRISIGALTHSATALDIGLDYRPS